MSFSVKEHIVIKPAHRGRFTTLGKYIKSPICTGPAWQTMALEETRAQQRRITFPEYYHEVLFI